MLCYYIQIKVIVINREKVMLLFDCEKVSNNTTFNDAVLFPYS